jgi:malate synthase
MEEILYELREHISGLNAGRWDYIFSIIKKFKQWPKPIHPDRAQITMTVPFMRSYTDLLIRTCHKRGAHAMGGMAAYIPSRKDIEVNEKAMQKVAEDKIRESNDGFDGTWVAHPDLVPLAMDIFDRILGEKMHQKHRLRENVQVTADDLLNFEIPGGTITEAGMRLNINVGLLYIESWLRGVGAAAIHNLMEDAATAEISRAQLWQWIHHPLVTMDNGRMIDGELYKMIAQQEYESIKKELGPQHVETLKRARELMDHLVLDETFAEFLTLKAYEWL